MIITLNAKRTMTMRIARTISVWTKSKMTTGTKNDKDENKDNDSKDEDDDTMLAKPITTGPVKQMIGIRTRQTSMARRKGHKCEVIRDGVVFRINQSINQPTNQTIIQS